MAVNNKNNGDFLFGIWLYESAWAEGFLFSFYRLPAHVEKRAKWMAPKELGSQRLWVDIAVRLSRRDWSMDGGEEQAYPDWMRLSIYPPAMTHVQHHEVYCMGHRSYKTEPTNWSQNTHRGDIFWGKFVGCVGNEEAGFTHRSIPYHHALDRLHLSRSPASCKIKYGSLLI